MQSDDNNPFRPPNKQTTTSDGPARPSSDPSIEHEPHLRPRFVPPDVSEDRADMVLAREAIDPTGADEVEHTVWDEPALSATLSGPPPEGQLTYARWFDEQRAATTPGETWWTVFWVALAAGPWGVVGAIAAQSGGGGLSLGGVMGVVVLAPVTEEITKVAAALWVVEKRPFLFNSAAQVLLCALAGGLAFAVIENLIYLLVYNPDAGPAYAAWRWTVCTALHAACSTIAGCGLVRVWRRTHATRQRPELAHGMPMFAAAMVVHGCYNGLVTLAEALGLLEL